MASLHTQPARPSEPPTGWRVVRVPPAMQLVAIARLLAPRADDAELRRAAQEFRQNLEAEGFDATRLWAAVEHKPDGTLLLGQTCMVVESSGRTAGVYCSFEPPLGVAPVEVLGVQLAVMPLAERFRQRVAVIKAALQWMLTEAAGEGADLHLAQALIEPHQEDLASAFEAGGFKRLAELAYLRRDIPRFGRLDEPVLPADVQLVRVSELGWENAQEPLLAAMKRSYIGTMDCPALCEIRDPRDVLASHYAVGVFDPALWTIVMHNGQPEGCMLLSPFEQHETVELVYLGLGPNLRGRGLGAALLQLAVRELQARGTRSLACAVDLTNEPALRLYKAAKFRQFAKRLGLVADVRAGAR